MDHNIKQRGRQYHYIRRIPEDVQLQIGKKWIEKSLRTRDKPTARRKRDVEDQANEKLWDGIRRAKEAGRVAYSNDPRVEALREHRAFQASDAARDVDAVRPDEPYEEKLQVLLEVVADTNRLNLDDEADAKEAMRLLRDTPEGRLMLDVYAAAQGNATIDLAGEEYLKAAPQAPETKRLYRGVYRHAAKTLIGAQEATVARIIGHKHKEITFRVYGGKADPETLRPLLDKLRYEL